MLPAEIEIVVRHATRSIAVFSMTHHMRTRRTRRGAHRSVEIARMACVVLGALLLGCAPLTQTLRSDHYRLRVPDGWQVDAASQPTVLRASPGKAQTDGYRPEVRIYAWPADGPLEDPLDVALAHLGAESPDLAEATPQVGDGEDASCGALPRGFPMFDEAQRVAHLTTPSARAIVTAGESAGSLIALVGVVPNGPATCDHTDATLAAMKTVSRELAPGFDPTAPYPPPKVPPTPIVER